jgi:acylphosphatase
MSSNLATRLLIRGRVQGVGYRAWFATEAERRRLAGWVRNRRDGSVEALILASAESLRDLIEASRSGPPAARVTEVAFNEEDVQENEGGPGFDVRPTA